MERASTAGGTPDAAALEFARLVRSRLGERVRQIILFGSRARGEARPHSDYDVVVVVDRRSPEIREAILEELAAEGTATTPTDPAATPVPDGWTSARNRAGMSEKIL